MRGEGGRRGRKVELGVGGGGEGWAGRKARLSDQSSVSPRHCGWMMMGGGEVAERVAPIKARWFAGPLRGPDLLFQPLKYACSWLSEWRRTQDIK